MNNFSTDLAIKYGIIPAILFKFIANCVAFESGTGEHFENGFYWTFNTAGMIIECYPYMTITQVRRGLKKLETAGLIIKNGDWQTLTRHGEQFAGL